MERAFPSPSSSSSSTQFKPSCSRISSTYIHQVFPFRSNFLKSKAVSWNCNVHIAQRGSRLIAAVQTSSNESGSDSIAQPGLDDMPMTVELKPILDESHFDQVVAEAEQAGESVVILWKASWCRKCIYLKPKLEKLAADYYPSVRFCSIDVNNVPHKLVVRAGVTKMPTIQLWRDGKKQTEVIGGHTAHLVVNEVRDMIENEDCP